MSKPIKIVAVTGPTATGKTRLAVELARRWDGEIVSADSRQVYRYHDIGSGKDLAEYEEVPYHLIDVAEPGASYHLKAFLADARTAIADIAQRGKLPVVCGGSALYLHALLQNYELPGGAPTVSERAEMESASLEELQAELKWLDPEFYANFADRNNFTRLRRQLELRRHPAAGDAGIELEALTLGVLYPRETVRRRIAERLDARVESGLVEEVRDLHDIHGMSWEQLEFLGLEYRYVAEFLQGKRDFADMRETLLNNIRQFAKRQDIFFRKMEREGVVIHWLEQGDIEVADRLVQAFAADEIIPPPHFRLADHKNPDLSK